MSTLVPPRVLATFVAGGHHFALEIAEVLEVLPMAALTAALGAPGHVAGLLDLHGQMVPVVDLRTLLGLPAPEPGLRTPLVLARSPDGPVGLIVDEVGDVVAGDDVTGVVPSTAPYADAVTRAVRIAGRVVLVLNPAWLAGAAR